jgi:hypothetical protein
MTAAIQLVFFMRIFAVGTIAPVPARMLTARGATIETIPLPIGAYSVTVDGAEFPSGVLADPAGQKRVFLLSALFAVPCFGLTLVSRSRSGRSWAACPAGVVGFAVSSNERYRLIWPVAGVLLLLCAGLRMFGRNKKRAGRVARATCFVRMHRIAYEAAGYFALRMSRISVSSATSCGGAAGAAGFASSFFLSFESSLTTKNTDSAISRKSTIVWMNAP